jgi:hypothetical protein
VIRRADDPSADAVAGDAVAAVAAPGPVGARSAHAATHSSATTTAAPGTGRGVRLTRSARPPRGRCTAGPQD